MQLCDAPSPCPHILCPGQVHMLSHPLVLTHAICLSTKGRPPTSPRSFPPCLAGMLVRVPRPIAVPSSQPYVVLAPVPSSMPVPSIHAHIIRPCLQPPSCLHPTVPHAPTCHLRPASWVYLGPHRSHMSHRPCQVHTAPHPCILPCAPTDSCRLSFHPFLPTPSVL